MTINRPHGGVLINCIDQKLNLQNITTKIEIDQMALSDLELIANGAYSPLKGFMCQEDYESVVKRMRLKNGTLWSIPITLPIDEKTAQTIRKGEMVKLVNNQEVYGVMKVRDVYEPDKEKEAVYVFGTSDRNHPGVEKLFNRPNINVSGDIKLIKRPKKEFPEYHFDPSETREKFKRLGWKSIAGFIMSNLIFRAHEYLQKVALEIVDGLFLHSLVGKTKQSEIPIDVQIASYETLLNKFYPYERVWLAIFPAARRYAGPREAIFDAIVRKNYGCTHFVVGCDHASVGDYYGAYDAQQLVNLYEDEIGIQILYFKQSFYCKICRNMTSEKTCPHSREHHVILSDEKVKEMVKHGEHLPSEWIRPEVMQVFKNMKNKQA